MTAQTAKFRFIGTTDECVECQACGKTDLRATVVLAILDADGNAEEITYYGSTCAARALGIRGGGRAVLQSARWAQQETAQQAKDARKRLAFYNWPETGEPAPGVLDAAVTKWADVNWHWACDKPRTEWVKALREARNRDQSAIADAILIGT